MAAATAASSDPSTTSPLGHLPGTAFRIDFQLWQPLSVGDESFSEDLIRQFDLKRASLYGLADDGSDKTCQDSSSATTCSSGSISDYQQQQQQKQQQDYYKVRRKDPATAGYITGEPKGRHSLLSSPSRRQTSLGAVLQEGNFTSPPPSPATATTTAAASPPPAPSPKLRSSGSRRNLLHKSSRFFRERIMKIKTNKESPVSSTITTDSCVEPATVLHYPPKPLHYSPEIHPPADSSNNGNNSQRRRRSLPALGSSSSSSSRSDAHRSKSKRSPAAANQTQRPQSHRPDKRRSFIIRSLLRA